MPEETKVKQEDHDRAVAQFQKTLDHFKCGRKPLSVEVRKIYELLLSGIPLYEIVHGISGMRYEPKTQTYDPSKHINIFRLFDAEKRAKLVTLSTQEQQRLAEKQRR